MRSQRPLPDRGLRRGRLSALLGVGALALIAAGPGCECIAGIETVERATGGAGGAGGEGGGLACEGADVLPLATCDSKLNGNDAVSLGGGLSMDACVLVGSLTDAGIPASLGGLLFSEEDPDTLLVVGAADTPEGALYSIPLLRDGGCHIAGLGAPTKIADIPYADGLIRGPGGALFFGLGRLSEPFVSGLGRKEAGSLALDEQVDLTSFGLDLPVSGVAIIPDAFQGAGTFVFLTYSDDVANNPGRWYSAELANGADGPLAVTSVTPRADFATPASIVFLPADNGVLPKQKVLVADHAAYSVVAYDLDANGVPKTAQGEPLFTTSMAGLGELGHVHPWGMARDPVSGDLLVDLLGDSEVLVALRGFAPESKGP